MRIIDTHCHIQFDAYDSDRDAVIEACQEKEIGLMVVGCDEKSSREAIAIVEKMGSGSISRSEFVPDPIFWCSVGQHPTDSGQPFDYKTFLDLAKSSKKVRAIGECGLDYYHLTKEEKERAAGIEQQKDLFFQHLNLAHELNLPLIIHCRDAHDDMIEMLVHRFGFRHSAQERGQAQIRSAKLSQTPTEPDPLREYGVLHCFTGTARDAQSYLDLGFMISFTGIITFTDQYDEVVRMVPLEKIMIETDSPFLAPVPHRGGRNSPEYVEYVARRIAEIKGVSFEEVAHATTENARRLFQLSS